MNDLVLSLRNTRGPAKGAGALAWDICRLWKPLADKWMEFEGEEKFKRQVMDARRGSCLAWINATLDEAGLPQVERRKELSYHAALRFVRWLRRDHPEQAR